MKHTIMRSRHQRVAISVPENQAQEWVPVSKKAVPDGHASSDQENASRVFDQTWEVRGQHLVRTC